MKCCICNKEFKFLDKISITRCNDGYVCKSCREKCPSLLFNISQYTSKEIAELIKYVQKNKEEFFCTTHYGKVFLDEAHGLLAYSQSERMRGNKANFKNNVFKTDDMDYFEISLSEPRITQTLVYSNILMYIQMRKFNISFNKVIKYNEKSKIKHFDNQSMTFDPPMGYIFIRAVINQMINNSINSFRKVIEELKEAKYEMEREKTKLSKSGLYEAKTILMLDDNYTQDDIKKHYRHLCKCLHPDVNQGYGDEYMQKINRAYELLTTKEKL